MNNLRLFFAMCLYIPLAFTTAKSHTSQLSHSELQIKAYILNRLSGIEEMDDPYRKAVLLRNFVYQNVKLGKDPFPLPITLKSIESVLSGKSRQICGGMAHVYNALLAVFGFNAREIYLADGLDPKSNTHVAVEVFINNRWILQDPTFNIHWELEGKRLSAQSLHQAFLESKNPVTNSDGYPLKEKQRVETYYVPYRQLLKHIEISNIELFHSPGGLLSTYYVSPDPISWRYYFSMTPLKNLKTYSHLKMIKHWSLADVIKAPWQQKTSDFFAAKLNDAILLTLQNNVFISPLITLSKGHYVINVPGRIVNGSFCMELVEPDKIDSKNRLMSCYIYPQFQNDNDGMVLDFEVKNRTKYALKLFPRYPTTDPSKWLFKEINIQRVIS